MNLIGSLHSRLCERGAAQSRIVFPSTKLSAVEFCETILGFALTSAQSQIIEASEKYSRVACRSGRRIGKSRAIAARALHFYCSYDDATVVLAAPTESQLEEVVWRDVVQLFNESGRCLACKLQDPDGPRPCAHSTCIDGELSASVRGGLRTKDGMRRIFGRAPRDPERARGIAGANQLILIDESSGVADDIFHALDGNRAGGARLVATGNPVDRSGWFFDAHHGNLDFHRIAIDSRTSPNCTLGRRIIQGLADPTWIAEKLREWGEDDWRWQVEVCGEFPSRDHERLIRDVDIAAAVERWAAMPIAGDLVFGIDPAGGGGGDASVIVVRRGLKVLEICSFDGGTDRIMLELDTLVRRHRRHAAESWRVNFDASSAVGADLTYALRNLKLRDDFLIFDGLESRGDARAIPLLRSAGVARPKDAYWLSMCQRLKTEVGIPFDDELRAELIFAEWQADRENGSRLIEKRQFRKTLGRSPDRADALAYCLWEGRVAPLSRAAAPEQRIAPVVEDTSQYYRGDPMGPWGASAFDPFRRVGAPDTSDDSEDEFNPHERR